MAVADHHTCLVEGYHERMDWVERKTHSIMFHWPRDRLCYSRGNSLDLADRSESKHKEKESYSCSGAFAL